MTVYAESYQYQLSSDAKQLLLNKVDQESFKGNGRFATNMVDEMIQAQASRLMEVENEEDLFEKSLLLEVEDVIKAINKM